MRCPGQSGSETRLVTLHTLSNLMPCIDRQRVVENAMRVIHSNFNGETTLQDSTLLQTYLLVILNMAAFYNAHAALLSFDVIGLLKEIATYALKRKNAGKIYTL